MRGDNNSSSKKLKLAIISRHFPPDMLGGCEEVIYNIYKKAREKYEAILIIGWRNDSEKLPESAYRVHLKNKNRFFDYLKFYFFCRRILKQEKPDLILVNTFEAPLKRIPCVSIIHDFGYESRFKGYTKFKEFIAKSRLKKAKMIIAVSNKTKQKAIELGLKAEKIRVIYSGINYEKFKDFTKENKKFTIVYPARIVSAKGQHIAIKAIKAMPKKMLDKIELILVGFTTDVNYLSRLRRMSEGLPIKIKPNVLNIEEYYQQADIVIFPTLMEEGFGFTALEAMACAKPVIYSDFAAIKEATGGIGLKTEPGNSNELAHKIQKLYFDKRLRESLRKEGLMYVRSHYDWDKTFREYQKVFDEVLSEGTKALDTKSLVRGRI